MSHDDLREALRRAASALKADGPPFALAGSYALWVHGGPEPSHDVDFVVAEEDVEAAAMTLSKAGFDIRRPPEEWLFKAALTVDWPALRESTSTNPFAAAFLSLCQSLGIAAG